MILHLSWSLRSSRYSGVCQPECGRSSEINTPGEFSSVSTAGSAPGPARTTRPWPRREYSECEPPVRYNKDYVSRAHHRKEPHHYINSHYSQLVEWIQEMERRKCMRDERRNSQSGGSSSHHRDRDRDRGRERLKTRPAYSKGKGVTYRYPDIQKSKRQSSRSNERWVREEIFQWMTYIRETGNLDTKT